MKQIFYILCTICIFSCNENTGNTKTSQPAIQAENITPTKDQQERRNKSEAICKLHKIPIYNNPNALFVDPAEEIKTRTKDEIVDRAIALYYIGIKSEGAEQTLLDKIDKQFNVSSKLTADEKAYAFSKHPTEQQKIDANWRYESLHVLLWSLGFIDSLSYPDTVCVVAGDTQLIYDLTEKEFREKAKLRTKQEILDQADLILRLDWACVNARLDKRPVPGNLDKDVVSERHHSLNWLIHYMNQSWDDVTTDT